ncbi:alpha/beta hydrolase [Sulfuricella sp. T08]|uniref:alpha/beta hydrolase n=1 Tax=Sulfuricella sp. T08 TaxID=1632857 RepID=UPI00192D0092|nr:alpha/beta hydrolase [Sulfuricella sp. T08]
MWSVLGVLAAAYAGLVGVLYFSQSSMVYYPEIGREMVVTPRQAGLDYEDVKLVAADGVALHGWFVPSDQSHGTVLFLHGNAGNISHRIDSLLMFHRLGYSTLIIDYRGYGNSSGKPSEQGTYEDAEAAWRHLTETRKIPSNTIVLFGESLGGAVVAWLAARHRPGALVLASGFTSVPDLAAKFYPFLPVRWLSRFDYDTRSYLRAVEAPVFIAHSPEDEIIPYQHGRALYDAAKAPKQFLELSGGHNEGFIFMRESWVQALGEFLNRHVGGAAKHDLKRREN